MPNHYESLAAIYDRAGLSRYAGSTTPKLVTFAQQNEWMGRRILDLGCGTGASTLWFARYGYMVTGVDHSPAMLAQTRAALKANSLNATLVEQDITNLTSGEPVDMALALDVLNELDNIKDLEAVFKNAHTALGKAKLFIFDLHTTRGLVERGKQGDALILDEDDLAVFTRSSYDYERQAYTCDYTIFSQSGEHWQRSGDQRLLKAFPVQVIGTLLKRTGFEMQAVLDDQLVPLAPGALDTLRVVFVAVKQ